MSAVATSGEKPDYTSGTKIDTRSSRREEALKLYFLGPTEEKVRASSRRLLREERKQIFEPRTTEQIILTHASASFLGCYE